MKKSLSNSRYAVLAWLAMVLLPSLSWATTYYVDNAIGNNNNDGLSWAKPLPAISAALSRSQQGDAVLVAAGRYAEAVSLRKGVSLKGGYAPASQGRAYNPSLYKAMICPNPLPNAEVHAVSANGITNASLEGFYILNGRARLGGGLYLVNCSSIIVNNNTIYSNRADGGAGIYAEDATGSLTNNNIHDNIAGKAGGGIKLQDATLRIQGNYIEHNTAASSGGGIYADGFRAPTPIVAPTVIYTYQALSSDSFIFSSGSRMNLNQAAYLLRNKIRGNITNGYGGGMYLNNFSAVLDGNDISLNQAVSGTGGGIYATSFAGAMINCLLSRNSAKIGAAMYANEFSSISSFINNTIADNKCGNPNATGGIYSTGINCIFKNNIFWNNGRDLFNVFGISYSLVKDVPGTGNISDGSNPLFVDPANGDFHLQAGSPCVNTGTDSGAPPDDLDGIPRPQMSVYDMGAYEYVPPPPMP